MSNPLPAHLVAQWHPEKNLPLTPDKVSAGSNKKVWWLGECTHSWESSIAQRVYGRGCPYCSGKQILKGFNDLATLKPVVASQWNHEKNLPLTLDTINVGSNKIVWWKNDACGHEWEMKVATRNDHVACSVCDGYIIQAGFNDLTTTHPDIAKEWHPTKNNALTPQEVSPGSGRKVWWLSKDCGHAWESIIKNRAIRGDSCLCCAGRMVITGVNDLATVNPAIATEWHPTKNLPLTAQTVSAGMGKKVWWLCASGHEWKTTIYSRGVEEHTCPFCSGRNAIVGVNDLATVNPKLTAEWDIQRNLPLTPQDVQASTNRKVWWVCPKGHKWDAQVTGRSRGQGCPVCAANAFVSRGEQEIADFITSQGLDIKQSDRRTLKGAELDIYVPSKKIAIEFNGLYWHSDLKLTDTKYHYNKWLAAKTAGIQLIQIWEDEWKEYPEQVKIMLLHKLGMSTQERVLARNTRAIYLNDVQVETFFKNNYVSTDTEASHYCGLLSKDNNELVAVIASNNEMNRTLHVVSYTTNKNVVGGFTKLLKFVQSQHNPSRVIALSDNCVSNGKLYENSGFVSDTTLLPDCKYVLKGKRYAMVKPEMYKYNALVRVWDAGKIRWVKEIL